MSDDGRTISDEDLLARFPGVRIDHDNKAYYRGLLQQRLLFNHCVRCGHAHHPPKPSCPVCWSWEVEARQSTGKGEVYLFSFINARTAHGADSDPYPVAAVDLREGVRFTATVVNCPKDELVIGLPVQLTWIEEDGMPAPAFEPASGGQRA